MNQQTLNQVLQLFPEKLPVVSPIEVLTIDNPFAQVYLQLWQQGQLTYEQALQGAVMALHKHNLNLQSIIDEHQMKHGEITVAPANETTEENSGTCEHAPHKT